MKIKVCGMTEIRNIQAVAKRDPDMMGFIFYRRSPRYMVNTLSSGEILKVDSSIQKVGVFVNEEVNTILQHIEEYSLDMIQLHGNESTEQCRFFYERNIPVIKVFSIEDSDDLKNIATYREVITYALLDTKTQDYGGSGKKFSWDILDNYNCDIPFFLSGGIGAGDTEALMSIDHPKLAGVDINSRFETSPGVKDPALVGKFIKHIRS